ncbi:MAG: ComEC/Rec2 family competence protein [Bryobacteraceae bacterium]
MRDPLLAPMAALGLGILLCRFVHFDARELAYILCIFAILTVFAALYSTRRSALLCALTGILFLGSATAERHRRGAPPQLNAENGETLTLAGCIVEPPAFTENREQFVVELAPHARIRVNFNLKEGEIAPPLHYGQKIEIDGKIRLPRNFQNPGSFDFMGYLARQDIYWTASARASSELKILPGRCGNRFWAAIYRIRVAALDRLELLYKGDAYATGMMEAMLLGESSKLEKEWTGHFRRTGTYHALVISGLHVSVLAAALLFLLRICFIPKDYALLIAAAGAWLYALVSGWQAPVVRSAGGFTLFLIAKLFYRRGRLLNLLAAVAITFLVFDPDQLYDPSFQLSFLSVAAIGALAVPLVEKTSGPYMAGLRKITSDGVDLFLEPRIAQFRVELRLVAEAIAIWTRIPLNWVTQAIGLLLRAVLYVYEMAAISLVVQIGLTLPMIEYFHRMSFSGLSANILVVPLLSAAIPAGFLSIFTGWHWPAAIANSLLTASQHVVDWHVRFEPYWRMPDPPLWLALSFVAALLSAAFLVNAGRLPRALAIVTLTALFILLNWQPFPPHIPQGKLELTLIDVGQGDSLLLTLPNAKTMLIDGGGFPSFGTVKSKAKMDIGEDVVSPYLWSRAIRHIDVIVCTHAHEDHVGGVAALIENFQPAQVWTGANPPESPPWLAISQKAAVFGAKIVPLRTGDTFEFGGARIDVLAPERDYEPASSPKNNDSLVFRVTYGVHRFLFTGDMEKQVEARLLEENRVGHVDVLKVAHHGSRSSSIEPFIEKSHPTFALISVGEGNSYHHPTPEVLERLNQAHAQIFRTDQSGLVSIRSDGKKLEVVPEHFTNPHTSRIPHSPSNPQAAGR